MPNARHAMLAERTRDTLFPWRSQSRPSRELAPALGCPVRQANVSRETFAALPRKRLRFRREPPIRRSADQPIGVLPADGSVDQPIGALPAGGPADQPRHRLAVSPVSRSTDRLRHCPAFLSLQRLDTPPLWRSGARRLDVSAPRCFCTLPSYCLAATGPQRLNASVLWRSGALTPRQPCCSAPRHLPRFAVSPLRCPCGSTASAPQGFRPPALRCPCALAPRRFVASMLRCPRALALWRSGALVFQRHRTSVFREPDVSHETSVRIHMGRVLRWRSRDNAPVASRAGVSREPSACRVMARMLAGPITRKRILQATPKDDLVS